jgi:very-short-patch-repair endonuclease
MTERTHVEVMAEQAGVISRRQALETGIKPHDIKRLLRRREWALVHPGVYVDHTGPLTWLQRAWAAVLFSWPAALCDDSALRAAEGPGRRTKREDTIHVAVHRSRNLVAPEGVFVHRIVGLQERAMWNLGPPRLRYEDAALEVALAAPTEFEAIAVLAEACSSRRTTAARMAATLATRKRAPRRQWVTAVLKDVADGTCSVLEHRYLEDVERAHALPAAYRQQREALTTGVVYRDAAYANQLIVELDGRLFHDSTEQRDKDMERDLDVALDGRATVRLSYGQVMSRPCATAGKIAALLQQRGWTGAPTKCGPDCSLDG